MPQRSPIPFSERFVGQDPQAIDLLEKMLTFDPRKRINAEEALAHPYLAPYHDPTDEPVAPEKFDWSFNEADLPIDTWKVMMYSEILDFHNVDNVDGSQFLGTPLTGPTMENPDGGFVTNTETEEPNFPPQ